MYKVVVGKNARDLAYALQRTKLDCERRLIAQQRDYQELGGQRLDVFF